MSEKLPEGLEGLEREVSLVVACNDFLTGSQIDREARKLLREWGIVELVEAAERVSESGRSYMRYHHEKFYGGTSPAPTGITPDLDRLDAALSRLRGEREGT